MRFSFEKFSVRTYSPEGNFLGCLDVKGRQAWSREHAGRLGRQFVNKHGGRYELQATVNPASTPKAS